MPQRSAYRDILVSRGMPGSNPQRQYRGEERMAQPRHVQPESPTPGAVEQCEQLTEGPGKSSSPCEGSRHALPASLGNGIQLDHSFLFL